MAHNSFSYVCLFQFSTCFEQPSAHHQESQLYQYDLWYMLPTYTVTYTRGRIDTIDSPDDEHMVARNMYRIGINKFDVCVTVHL
jgi:hypothetical protein